MSNSKTEILVNRLRLAIASGQIAPGGALPSLRELAEQFNVSSHTAKRACDQLQALRLIEIHPRRGAFVRSSAGQEPAAGPAASFAVSICRSEELLMQPSIYSSVLLGIKDTAARLEARLEIHFIDPAAFDHAVFAELNRRCHGIIMIGEYDGSIEMLEPQVPILGVGMFNNYGGSISIAELDPLSAAEQAACFFRRRRTETVTICANPDELKAPAFAERIRQCRWRLEEAKIAVRQCLLDDISPEFPGYLFVSGASMEGAARRYRKKFGADPDLSAQPWLGLDGRRLICPDFFIAPCIALDWQQVGAAAFREIHFRSENPGVPPKRLWFTGRLVES